MGKTTHLHNGSTARYLLNIPELDYCVVDALITSTLGRIGTQDIKAYYKNKGMSSPTPAAFSQALARLKQRGLLQVERHECLWIEFHNKKTADAIITAFKACQRAEEIIGGEA